jgi:DNA-binding NarL/FixJ family response regulator
LKNLVFQSKDKEVFSMSSTKKVNNIIVIDDHDAVINGTVDAISSQYSDVNIIKAKNAKEAIEKLNSFPNQDVVITDLSLPEKPGDKPQPDIGVQLLRTMMEKYPLLNLVVQSADARALIRLRPQINEHEGGFTVVEKSEPLEQMLTKVDWSLQGVNYTPKEMRTGTVPELKAEWQTLLELAFNECLTDKEIAKKMCIGERTVRNYWTKIQDALEIYPEDEKNLRLQTEKKAREIGLID